MSNHSALEPDEGSAGNAWTRFWFNPIPTTGLQCLRVLSGLVFLFWLLSFIGHQTEFFSLMGWMDEPGLVNLQKVYTDMQARGGASPPIGWSIVYLAGDNPGAFQAIYWGSILVLALFTLGIATRITGVLTWVVVVSFLANPAITYDGDYLLAILAFYLMVGHLLIGQWEGTLSIAERILGSTSDFVFARWIWPTRVENRPMSHGANFIVRLFQVHFAIIIVMSGLHKLQIAEWWSGVALWFPLHPTFKTSLESLQREGPSADSTLFLLSLVQYLVLAWQLSLPFYAWRSGWLWRGILLGGAAIGWLGTMFLYQLPSFGPFVMIGCLSFLRPDEWAAILRRVRPAEMKGSMAGPHKDTEKVAVASRKDTNIKK